MIVPSRSRKRQGQSRIGFSARADPVWLVRHGSVLPDKGRIDRRAQEMTDKNVQFLDAGGVVTWHDQAMVGEPTLGDSTAFAPGQARSRDTLGPSALQCGNDVAGVARGWLIQSTNLPSGRAQRLGEQISDRSRDHCRRRSRRRNRWLAIWPEAPAGPFRIEPLIRWRCAGYRPHYRHCRKGEACPRPGAPI